MLALWEYFWVSADWAGGVASVSAADVVVLSGGARGHDYHPLPDEFWEVRERYIRRFVEPIVKQTKTSIPNETTTNPRLITKATIAQAKLRATQTERDILLAKARLATNRQDLQQHSARILQLSLDILKTNDQYYEQAAIILLLDIF